MGNETDPSKAKAPSADDLRAITKMKGKADRLWLKLQQAYDLIESIPSSLNSFMIRSAQVEKIAEEYEVVLSELDVLGSRNKELSLDTMKLASAFNDLFYKILEVREQHKSKVNDRSAESVGSLDSFKSSLGFMPHIQIPRFSGDLEGFPGFIALYDKVIHNNSRLSDVEKFAYLLSYLDGRALNLAQTVAFDPNNYETVYELLKNEFSNVRVVASHYLNQIFSLNQIKANNRNALKELCDSLQANVNCLNKLDIPDLGQFILLFWSSKLLDHHTRRDFETKFLKKDFPDFSDLINFLRDRCAINELSASASTSRSTEQIISHTQGQISRIPFNKKVLVTTRDDSAVLMKEKLEVLCQCCKGSHKFSRCPRFLNSSIDERKRLVQTHKRCYSCLGRHSIASCQSNNRCRKCGSKKHNTLICYTQRESSGSSFSDSVAQESGSPQKDGSSTKEVKIVNTCSLLSSDVTCILGTACAKIRDFKGVWHNCRLVLDPGSQVNFITAQFASRLGIPRRKYGIAISGVGSTQLSSVKGKISCSLTSSSDGDIFHLDAAIVDKITSDLPTINLPPALRKKFSMLSLADPNFDRASSIDMLLGVQSYLDLLPDNPQHIKGQPSAILTRLGWVIMGTVPSKESQVIGSLFTIVEAESLNDTLKKFWEVEEVILPLERRSPDEIFCEEYFSSTTSRDLTGRYITRLPFRDNSRPDLGSNRQRSLNRLYKLEARFRRDPQYHELYVENLKDYLEKGHMIPAPQQADYIMTHHGVLKTNSEQSKLRVVFSPAEKGSSGKSLNETLLVGPKLQSDIGIVVTQFRLFPVAVTCDIKQMYRAIILHPEDCKYQHIFWRFSMDDPVLEWELRTVTFGVSSSPYLAQRTIKQLILDEGDRYPRAAEILSSNCFMDDLLFGAFSEIEASELCKELVALLRLGGFELGKWASSHPSVSEDCSLEPKEFGFSDSSAVKVLGLIWDPSEDDFRFVVDTTPTVLTKRGILSRVARIYDYNGYLSPVTFAMKVILQRLWLLRIDWDEPLPSEIMELWNPLEEEFQILKNIAIPRCIIPSTPSKIQLVGFCDASILGMAANVYLRIECEDDIVCNLLCSKTKVAPLKGWTVNRLELGSAVLLSKLVRSLLPIVSVLRDFKILCFSDSSTTLAWIRTPVYKLKTFVANRVTQILEACPEAIWNYIPGEQNIADPASRGLKPSQLWRNECWWTGPDFLKNPYCEWPRWSFPFNGEIPETKVIPQVSYVVSVEPNFFMAIMERFSSLSRAQRVFSYIFRFLSALKSKIRQDSSCSVTSGPISVKEYREAMKFFIRITQNRYLEKEIVLLNMGKMCSPKFRSLCPFLDSSGFLLVGGRLKNSELPYHSKHPYVIPRESHLASLLCDHFHLFSGHGGPKLVQSLLQRAYYIPSARSLIRQRIFHCLQCYRFQAAPVQPPMADLPSSRVQPSRSFTHCGVDVGGPFWTKFNSRRNAKQEKTYITLFVCFFSRAVHIEVVASLSTAAFLAALDRFIARRGMPSHIYSDQGRNFRGAAREISEISRFLQAQNRDIGGYLAAREIQWIFNPPYAPNFGGIWEAGIKSVKYHLKRVIGSQVLTMEEFQTVCIRIEAILNSRPIGVLSSSPNDFQALTPGHFLIGSELLCRPEADIMEIPMGVLDRWQLTQQIVQGFWKQWSRECIDQNLKRSKWTKTMPPIKVGDVVLWYEPGVSPAEWPLGIIQELCKGPDEVVRVLKIHTRKGIVTRPTNKVVLLPFNN